MASYIKQRTQRVPEHPGAILKRVWLDELNFTQSSFADARVERSSYPIKKSTMLTKLSELINGKRDMCADFAVLITSVLHTTLRMWMNLQVNLDVWIAQQEYDDNMAA